ncbi:MAG: hypothetical protein ABW009_14625 [Acidimicrobiales bacterium]
MTDRGADVPETPFVPVRNRLVALNRQGHDPIVTVRLSDGRSTGDLSAR